MMASTNTILITGGCGYLGSHTAIDLLEKGFAVISIDNFSRSNNITVKRVEKITGKSYKNYAIDCKDVLAVRRVFEENNTICGIIHFAAYKSVTESVKEPLMYYDNNINSLLTMLKIANEFSIKAFVFSSSCSVYGNAKELPVGELTPLSEPESPYARTKLLSEQIIEEYTRVSAVNFVLLRYFNPAGAHESGLIGESPSIKPENIVPNITQTGIGKKKTFTVFGTDYPTRDGSCIRDYIHVMDVANAHTKALNYLLENRNATAYEIFNLGSGNGISVLELIHAFEKISGIKLNYTISERRIGDVTAIYADNKKAKKFLHWQCEKTIEDMMSSAWKWEQKMALSTLV